MQILDSVRLISPGLGNKVYNLNVYIKQSLYITKFILNKVYKKCIITKFIQKPRRINIVALAEKFAKTWRLWFTSDPSAVAM